MSQPRVDAATKRTFYVEKYGDEYRLVKVWERGTVFTPSEMMDYALPRVIDTHPDERIIAEQSMAVIPTETGARIVDAKGQEIAEIQVEAAKEGSG